MLDPRTIQWPAAVKTVLAELRRRGIAEDRLQRILFAKDGRRRNVALLPVSPDRRRRKKAGAG
jgi:hypothetical protein